MGGNGNPKTETCFLLDFIRKMIRVMFMTKSMLGFFLYHYKHFRIKINKKMNRYWTCLCKVSARIFHLFYFLFGMTNNFFFSSVRD